MADLLIVSPHLESRALMRLRVSMRDIDGAMQAFPLLAQPLRWSGSEMATLWIAPDQWLLASVALTADQMKSRCDTALLNSLHFCMEVTDALACVAVEGRRARQILGMLSAADFGSASFPAGHCMRVRMAKIAVIVCAMAEERFELFLDRSFQRYLQDCLERAAGVRVIDDLPVTPDYSAAS